jgi:hypothetical protein
MPGRQGRALQEGMRLKIALLPFPAWPGNVLCSATGN